MTPEQASKVDQLLCQRNKIGAIKEYRICTGCSLTEAKAFADAREQELKQLNPAAFEKQPIGCAAVAALLVGAPLLGAGLYLAALA